jgi:mRNA interferase RelE/StbE
VNNYSVEVKPTAWKELEALPDIVLARIVRKLESLRKTPLAAGMQKLKGHKDQWRVRVGDGRVIYLIDDTGKLVSITRIAHRREERVENPGRLKLISRR